MNQQTTEKAIPRPVNWKIVIFAWVIVAVIGLGFWLMEEKGNNTAYCRFERNLTDDAVLRYECAVLKIITKDMNEIDFNKFVNLNISPVCSYKLNEIEECHGETYHFLNKELAVLCDDIQCGVDGVLCGAYFITYYNNTDESLIARFERNTFTENNLTRTEVIKLFDKCNV